MDPDFDPTRYHELIADDFVVFGFDGVDGLPTAVYMVLLSQSEPVDLQLLNQVLAIGGGRSMAEVSMAQLQSIVQASPANHPIRELLETERDGGFAGGRAWVCCWRREATPQSFHSTNLSRSLGPCAVGG